LRQSRTDLLAQAPPSAAVMAARRTRSGLDACDRQIKCDPQTSRWFYVAIRRDGTATENTSYAGSARRGVPREDARRVDARALPPSRSPRRPCP
jgi:hypothetical protein